MEKWEQSLNNNLESIDGIIADLQVQRSVFVSSVSKNKDDKCYEVIVTMFDLLEAQCEDSKLFIQEELRKLRALKDMR